MKKALKLWNGSGNAVRKNDDPLWQGFRINAYSKAYVAAYSRADARRVIVEYCGHDPGDAELRDYWHECWGKSMQGITPERGLWVDLGNGPVKVI